MRKIIYCFLLISMVACTNNNKFTIEGVIDGGAGDTIYLEHTGLNASVVIDSAEIKSNGEFRFKANRPSYPDFYKLIVNGKQLHFAVDSTETIRISASLESFSTNYEITGSLTNNDIQKLRISVASLQKKADELAKAIEQTERDEMVDLLTRMIEEHKAMARSIILKNPKSAAAYFAIFQKVNDIYIFSPYEKEDRPYCAAVATSYHTFMPEYERSKNLHALVLDAINAERMQRRQQTLLEMLESAQTGFIDIELPDRNGVIHKLSDLKGKVILLDFSAYESRESVQYTFALRELHRKYSSAGLVIYQVSLDRNKTIWNDATATIPWISVRDLNGPATTAAVSYNVTSIPTYFLIDAKGDIVGRDMNLKDLENAISQRTR